MLKAQYVGLHEKISEVIALAGAYPDAMNLGGATAAASLYPAAKLQSISIKLTNLSTGLSIEALEVALVAYTDVKAVVVVPNLQNPTGSVMPDNRKSELVRLCAARGVALIEDDPYGELMENMADGISRKALKSWDREGGVIYCASLNKVLAPGLRLGWISPGR